MLRLESVSRHFGGLAAVRDVDLNLRPGALTGMIGPNGAGKTTLINMISGHAAVSAGKIWIDDKEITGLDPDTVAKLGIARTFQNSRLFGRMSVLDTVMVACQEGAAKRDSVLSCLLGLPGAYRTERKWRASAEEMLARFQMERYAKQDATTLAYGLQRRVEIMRALALTPSVLLLDEPVAGMNDIEANELGDIFRAVSAEGIAVLLIEHNVPFVTELCDFIHVLSHGRMIAQGSPAEVVRNTAVIEAYLGA
jgi:branched-chain amino acid transport system ATP-binding protein